MDENENKENQEQVDQEELAKQWEESLANSSEDNTGKESSDQSDENIDQEELAKQWEEALQQQSQENQDEAQEQREEVSQEDLAKQWEEALSQQGTTDNQEDLANQWEQALKEQEESSLIKSSSEYDEKLELLLDIPLEISVEVGNKLIPLEDILKMTPNTVIELERYIEEPVDIKVNGKLIAKGELYTVENNFGIKITSIITVQERMKLLMEENGNGSN